ncbi:Protein-S-isoprenylcysteine O-methyltransferase [Abortiporus biennis]
MLPLFVKCRATVEQGCLECQTDREHASLHLSLKAITPIELSSCASLSSPNLIRSPFSGWRLACRISSFRRSAFPGDRSCLACHTVYIPSLNYPTSMFSPFPLLLPPLDHHTLSTHPLPYTRGEIQINTIISEFTIHKSLLAATCISTHASLSPPNPPALKKQCVARRTVFEKCILWVTFITKAMVWMFTLADALATYTAYSRAVQAWDVNDTIQSNIPRTPSSFIQSIPCFCPATSTTSNTTTSLPYSSPSILLSSALLSPSPLLVLGSLMKHRLVIEGPYSYVRHPSYTGVYLTLLGGTLVGLAPGSWVTTCWLLPSMNFSSSIPALRYLGIGQILVFAFVIFWCVKVYYAMRSTYRRLFIEDQELQKVFGKTWDSYAQRVQWRVLPGIL